MAENSVLSALAHIVAIVLPIITSVVGAVIWVVHRIERGQGDLKDAIAIQGQVHRKDFKKLRRELKQKVDRDECAQLREGCLCGYNKKGKKE